LLLVRHVIESVDGVAILVSGSGSHPCQPLLRSALEAVLGVLYILEKDTKQRGLAYQVAHAHKKIKLYDRLDPTTQAGKQLRKVLHGDPMEGFFSALPFLNYPKMIANLQDMLVKPGFQPIEGLWQRIKALNNKRDPEWYSLSGGPKNVREVAVHLRMTGMYEFLYRFWSESVHAGMAMEAIGRNGGATVILPVRHPDLAKRLWSSTLQPSGGSFKGTSCRTSASGLGGWRAAHSSRPPGRTRYCDRERHPEAGAVSRGRETRRWAWSASPACSCASSGACCPFCDIILPADQLLNGLLEHVAAAHPDLRLQGLSPGDTRSWYRPGRLPHPAGGALATQGAPLAACGPINTGATSPTSRKEDRLWPIATPLS
jgi:hypothetical protein